MFIVVQFPIADMRDFIDYDTFKLNAPSLPFISPFRQEFIRCFGPLKNRYNQDGVEYCETVYSRANRALRLPELGTYKLGRKHDGFIPTCVFRRFFANNETCKIEIGFKNIEKYKFYESPLDDMEFLNLLIELMEIPALIPSDNHNSASYKLKDTGEKLSSLYLHATTKYPLPQDKQLEKSWIQAGNPMILVEYDINEIVKLPKTMINIASLEEFGIRLSHTIIYSKNNNSKIRVWLIGKKCNSNKDTVRKLRINLLRLNAEQECLKQVLNFIQRKKIVVIPFSDATDRLQDYINTAIRNISKKERYGIPNNEIIEVSNSYENIINQNERIFLLAQLEKIRNNIYKKLESYIAPNQISAPKVIVTEKDGVNNIFIEGIIQEGGITVTNTNVTIGNNNNFSGNTVIASILKDCNNTIDNMKPENKNEESLKQNLTELKILIEKLCIELPEDQSEQVAKDMDNLSKEVISKKPRKDYFELFEKRIIETAKYCSSLVNPITQAIKDVMLLINNFI